jgi:hypothetical protein
MPVSVDVGEFSTVNVKWKVVLTSSHRFRATAPGFPDVNGASWDDVENHAKVLASKARIKVDVPFVTVEWRGFGGNRHLEFQRQHATGLHAGNGNILVINQYGRPDQLSRDYGALKPMDDEDGGRYLLLAESINRLTKEKTDLENKYGFGFGKGLKGAVSDAIDAAHAARAEAVTDGE